MLRAKRRRSRMYDSKGNPIFNTNNATSKEDNYIMKNNYLLSKDCKIQKKSNIRNPIQGYRKQTNCCEKISEDIIIIEYDKIVKDGVITINFPSDLSFTYASNTEGIIMNFSELFNGTYKKTDKKGIYRNIVKPQDFIEFNFEQGKWGISVYSGKVKGYIFLTSTSKNNFDIYKLKDQNFNWLITVSPSDIYNNYKIITNNYISNDKLNIIYDEIHVKSSKIIDSIIQFFPKKPLNDIYKDNYAKTCGKFRKDDSSIGKFCSYNNVILPKQNNNGMVDASYNYSTSQYLSRPNFMKCNNVYKKSNPRFSTQGAVSGGSRLNRLKYQTIIKSQQKYNKL